MELDLKYNQYNIQEQLSDKTETNKPYQEVIDYFEKNLNHFSYNDFYKVISKIQNFTKLNLSDGTQVEIGVADGIINVGIIFSNGSKFIGSYSNISDVKEFVEKINKVPHS